MNLAPRLDLRQSQSLVMTPQLQQAIRLLALSNLEVEGFIAEEIEKNPLLESASGEGEAAAEPAEPTERGMERFARAYVDAVASNPSRSWQMLTPKFQRESGGFDTYREFWSGVGEPEVLEVAADPDALVVSYRVRFENFGTGERPTVLQLVHEDGSYRIDGELTEGFDPVG